MTTPQLPQRVSLVAHTHWDREWYEPFQRFRLRLVDLMDDVLARAAASPDFRFTMDGQLAAVDDYLELRPEQEPLVRRLVESGQLAVGPWRVLMDEFLCSGETMLRNLELGWARAEELGGAMPVGYVPDMFGHAAQLPQLLAVSGIERACVYRGVPASVTHHEFWWESPDGTGVRTEFLVHGYGNAADLFMDVPERSGDADAAASEAAVHRRLVDRMAVQAPAFDGDDFLAMYGTDHAAPLPGLLDLVAALDADPDGPRIGLDTLAGYLREIRTPRSDLVTLRGELRAHARSNLLPGVLSVRWQLKQGMADAERMLTRYAEPFAALLLATQPQAYLDLAWRDIIDSSCHDSVTGCGVDETAVQVEARLAEAEHAAQAVRDQALAEATAGAPRGSLVVVNPLPWARVEVVDVVVPVPEEWESVALAPVGGVDEPAGTSGAEVTSVVAAEEISRPERVLATEQVPASRLTGLMHRVHDRELFGVEVLRIEIDDLARRLVFQLGDHGDEPFDAVVEGARVAAAAARCDADELWEVVTVDEPRRRLLARVPVPATGWSSWRVVDGGSSSAATDLRGCDGRGGIVDVEPDALDNGLVRVQVRADGALTVTGPDGVALDGVGRLVDGGDCGDTYNYAPPATDRVVDEPTSVQVRAIVDTGVAGTLEVVRRYELPRGLEGGDPRTAGVTPMSRTDATVPTDVTMAVELRAGEPFVRLRMQWENRSMDHRLRLHVPTARPTRRSSALGQLAVVDRGLTAEAGPVGEHPLPTFPAEQLVDAGGVGVVLGRTMEYELVSSADRAGARLLGADEEADELALTLLRATGWLSRNVHPYRSEPAGPQLAVPRAQVLGPAHAELAVVPHGGDWESSGMVRIAEEVLHPVLVLRGTGAGSHADPGRSLLSLETESGGVVVTAVRRRGELLEVRVVNLSSSPADAKLRGPDEHVSLTRRADAMGRPGAPLELDPAQRAVRISLRPWEIATVQLG